MFQRLYNELRRRHNDKVEMDKLFSMSDRELQDIGLARYEIRNAFYKGRK